MVKALFLFYVVFLLFVELGYGIEGVERVYYDYVNSYSYEVLDKAVFSGLAVWQSGDMYVLMNEKPVYSSLREVRSDFLMSEFRAESRVMSLPSFITVTVIKDQANATVKDDERVLYSKEYVIYFNLNKFSLTKGERKKLDDIISEWKNKCLEDCEIRARVSGAACYLGSDRYNKSLSLKRSDEVLRYLNKELKNLVVVSKEGRGEVRDSDVICLNRKVTLKLECFCGKRNKD